MGRLATFLLLASLVGCLVLPAAAGAHASARTERPGRPGRRRLLAAARAQRLPEPADRVRGARQPRRRRRVHRPEPSRRLLRDPGEHAISLARPGRARSTSAGPSCTSAATRRDGNTPHAGSCARTAATGHPRSARGCSATAAARTRSRPGRVHICGRGTNWSPSGKDGSTGTCTHVGGTIGND